MFKIRRLRLAVSIRNYFFTGLAVLVPIFITLYLVIAIFKLVDGILGRFINKFLLAHYGYFIPGLGLVITISLILIVGFMASRLFGGRLYPYIEKWFYRIPLVKQIYPPSKQVVDFIFSKEKFRFRRVALVEYPSKGVYQLGFITQEHIEEINKKTQDEMVGVLISNTPSPITGFLAFVPKKNVILLDMSIEDGMKLLISGGVVKPDSKG